MKMYHEVAQVKDGQKRVGWLLAMGSAAANSMFAPLYYVSEDEFHQNVKNGLIQYFTMKGNNLAIEYTEEELTDMKKAGVKSKPTTDLREYLMMDVSLQYSDLYEAFNGGKPYVYGISARKLMGKIYCQVWIFCGNQNKDSAYNLIGDLNLLSEAEDKVFIQASIKGSAKVGHNCIYAMPTIQVMELWKKHGLANISMKSAKTALQVARKMSEGNRKHTRRVSKLYDGAELEEIIKRVET